MSTKMNPEVKARWVEALRSGKYRQGLGQYRSEKDEYCCLGVLCTILPDVTLEGRPGELIAHKALVEGQETGNYDWFFAKGGPSHEDALFLAGMNDNGRKFSKIADWIEENL